MNSFHHDPVNESRLVEILSLLMPGTCQAFRSKDGYRRKKMLKYMTLSAVKNWPLPHHTLELPLSLHSTVEMKLSGIKVWEHSIFIKRGTILNTSRLHLGLVATVRHEHSTNIQLRRLKYCASKYLPRRRGLPKILLGKISLSARQTRRASKRRFRARLEGGMFAMGVPSPVHEAVLRGQKSRAQGTFR